MRQFLVGAGTVAIIAVYAATTALIVAWFTVFPSIGILWSIGWLK